MRSKINNAFIGYVQGFKQIIHAILLTSFMGVAGFMFWQFILDIKQVAGHTTTTDDGLLHAFGTLLVLWTVTELITAEISVMKGHRFGVAILVDVAIAAIVRKVLISDFKADTSLYVALVALVVMAFVRRVISDSDRIEALAEKTDARTMVTDKRIYRKLVPDHHASSAQPDNPHVLDEFCE